MIQFFDYNLRLISENAMTIENEESGIKDNITILRPKLRYQNSAAPLYSTDTRSKRSVVP